MRLLSALIVPESSEDLYLSVQIVAYVISNLAKFELPSQIDGSTRALQQISSFWDSTMMNEMRSHLPDLDALHSTGIDLKKNPNRW